MFWKKHSLWADNDDNESTQDVGHWGTNGLRGEEGARASLSPQPGCNSDTAGGRSRALRLHSCTIYKYTWGVRVVGCPLEFKKLQSRLISIITRASARGVQVTLDSSSPRQPQPQFPQFKDFVRCSRKNSLRETCESAITIDWNYH